jgi:hypothetical protein
MNEKNYEYLSKQLQFTGFGDTTLQPQLKEAMQRGEAQFMLTHVPDFDKQHAAVTLHFKKSDTQDMYFFNRFNIVLKNPQQEEAMKQSFYINANQDNISLKEGYNLMHGRAVYKEMTPKEGEKYNAWVQLDFKNSDAGGNFKMRQFNDNYGFRLEEVLNKHPLKELGDPAIKDRLMESLQRGNRQSATMEKEGVSLKVFIEAAPQFKSLNFFTEKGNRLTPEMLHAALEPGEKKENNMKMARSAKEELNGEDDDGAKQRKGKRKGVTV